MKFRTLALGLFAAAGITSAASAQNLVTNPSFENGFSGWINFNNAYVEPVHPRTGALGAKFFGNSGARSRFGLLPGVPGVGG